MSDCHKLVRHVRDADEPWEIDLGNVNETQAHKILGDAFAKSIITNNHFLRYQFIVGGGKNCRQKYNEQLPKYCAEALTKIGYENDRHCASGSQGAFKFQHDTDKNLKVLYVYPKTEEPAKVEEKSDEPQYSERQRLVCCSEELFEEYLGQLDFSELEKTLERFKSYKALLPGILAKMMKGETQSAEDEELYGHEEVINVKLLKINETMGERIRNGQISRQQRDRLLEQMQSKMRKVAKAEGKPPSERTSKHKRLLKQKDRIQEQIEILEAIQFSRSRRGQSQTKEDKTIQNLRDKLALAKKLELEWQKGKTLNSKEVRLVGQKDLIEKRLRQLE